jgi:CubicO group peptidase (beta-lactamase class C family)
VSLAAALAQIDNWPVPSAAAAVVSRDGVQAAHGDVARPFRLASLTKLFTGWAALIAVEEGIVSLETPIGQPGCTLRHLLAHAGGYPFDGADPIAPPATRRIYSNTGIELAAEAVAAAAAMSFGDYVDDAVFNSLGMADSVLRASAAHGAVSTVGDLAAFCAELLRPTLIHPSTAAMFSTVQFPALKGVLPGFGAYDPCPWGLGCELRGHKTPHWTGAANSPSAFGHFGGAGTMLWVDPAPGLALVALADRPFDEWAETARVSWPALSDAVLAER